MITNINKIANLNGRTNADKLAKRNNSFNSFDTNRKFAKANKKDVMSSFAELVQHRDAKLDNLKGKHIEEDVKLKSPFEELPLNGISSFISSLKPNSGSQDILGVLSELNDNPFSDSSLIPHTDNQTMDSILLYAIDKPLNKVLDSGLSKLEQSILNKNGLSDSTKKAINMLDKFTIQETSVKDPLAEMLDGKAMKLNSQRPIGKGIGEQLSDELLKLGIKINFDQNNDNTISIKGLEFADDNIDNARTIQDLLKNLESNGLLKSSIKTNDLELNKIASKYNTGEESPNIKLEINKQVFSKETNHDLDFAGGKEQQSNSSDFSKFGKMNQEFSPINSSQATPSPEQLQRTKLDELPQTIVKIVAETPANGSSQAILHLNPDNLGKGIGEQLSDELLKLGIKINFDQNNDNTISIKGLEFADDNIDNARTIQDLLKNLESNGLLKSSIKTNDLELNKIASKYNTGEESPNIKLEINKQVFSKETNHDLDFAGGKEQQSNSSDFSKFGKMNQEFSPINSSQATPSPEQLQRTKLDELPQTIVKIVAETPANGSSQAILHLNPDNLGKVKVEIMMQDNSVHLKITAESEEAKASIGEQLNSLREKLNENGLKTSQIDLFTQQDSQYSQSENPQKRQEENDARRQYIDMMRRMQDLDKSIPLDTTINNNSKA